MAEFTVGTHNFRSDRLTPKIAFHVARRIAPLLGALKDLKPFMTGERKVERDDLDAMADILTPIVDAVALMPDADVNYIIDACTRVVKTERAGGTGWAPIGPDGEQFDWIDMPMLLQIVFHVVRENVMGFLPAGAPAG